jgi:hypothetical protein
MDRLALMAGWLGLPVREQVLGNERRGMSQVRIRGQDQRRPFPHDPHSGMAMAVNPTLMALGLAGPPLPVEIVPRQVPLVTTEEEARSEAPHHPGHLLPDRVAIRLEAIAKGLESGATPVAIATRRIEHGGHLDDLIDVLPDRDLSFLDRAEPPIDVTGQATPERLGTPPSFAPRSRRSDGRTSPNASAIRNPGGWSGPP